MNTSLYGTFVQGASSAESHNSESLDPDCESNPVEASGHRLVSPAPDPDPEPDRTRRPSLARRVAGRTLKAFGWSVAGIAACVMLALIGAATLHNAQRVREALLSIQHVARYAPLVYLALFACLWWRWNQAVEWVIRRGYVPESARELLRSRRDRWVTWLCVLTLLMAWLGMR